MKRLISTALLAAVFLCALWATPSVSAASTQGCLGRVTADDTLNLRAEPNTDSEILDKVEGGETVMILGSAGTFFKVSYGGSTGYLSDQYTVKLSYWVGVATADRVNLRSEASTSSKVLGTIDAGDKVNVYGTNGEFYLVVSGTQKCYVHQDYITKQSTASATSTSSKSEGESTAAFDANSEKYYVDDPIEFTGQDLYLAAQLIYSEGKNQSEVSYQAMASVVYNRVASSRFPDTVEGVTFQENQFSHPDSDPEEFLELVPSEKAIEAVVKVFVEGKRILPPEVMFFKSASLSKSWGPRVYYATIGGNMYYS